jgi:hypothetical protein
MGSKRYTKSVINKDPKKFTNAQLRYIFRRIIARIKQKPRGHFELKKLRGCMGLCCWEEGISIDFRKELIPTIIHEVIHDLYPKNWEGWVYRVESKIVNILTVSDIYELMKTFFSRLKVPNTSKVKAKRKKNSKR